MTQEATPVASVREEDTGRAGRALVWSFANTAAGRLGTLAIGIVLARLLGPDDFGTYAVAFVALMAILSFNELGVSLAIVRWPDDPRAIAPTVTTISVAMSAILTGLGVLVAPWFASAMGDPDATRPVQLLCLCVLVNGAVATPAALMQRAFQQDRRMVVDQVNVWAGAFVSLGLALSGAGAMSLVIGRLAGATLSALLFLYYSPLPYRFGLRRRHVRPLLEFGLPLAGASVIVFLVGFVDQLVVGHRLGPVALGYYVLAFNLASWPVAMLSQPLRSVAPALFSRLQHDPDRMRSGFRRVLRPLTAVALPVCAALAMTATDVVRFVYGAAWAPAGPVLQWLAVLAGFRILFELAYDYLVVLGRSRSILMVQLVWIAALVPTLWLGVGWWGIEGGGVALVLVSASVSLPMYVAELRRSGLRTDDLGTAALTSIGASVLVAVACGLLLVTLDSVFWGLAASGLATAVTSGGLLWRYRSDLGVFRERVA